MTDGDVTPQVGGEDDELDARLHQELTADNTAATGATVISRRAEGSRVAQLTCTSSSAYRPDQA
jgi:hypothetical protein